MIINKYDLVAIVGTFISVLPLYMAPLQQAAAEVIMAEAVPAEAPASSAGSKAHRLNAGACVSTEAPSPDAPEVSGCSGEMEP